MTEKQKKEIKQSEQRKGKRSSKPPLWEWIFAILGLILVTGAISFMIYQATKQTKKLPNFVFKIDAPTQNSNGYLVEFELENTGDETASAVVIEGELKGGAESVEKSSATLNYAPSHSKRQGGLLFTKNPNDFELKIRVAGYEKP